MEDGVAPTDCRNRPDQRYMENGNWDEANLEKSRLEEKQREARKARLNEGDSGSKHNTKSVRSNSTTPPTSLGMKTKLFDLILLCMYVYLYSLSND